MSLRLDVRFALALVLGLSLPQVAAAQSNVDVADGYVAQLSLDVASVFNSNFFFQPTAAQSASGFSLSPALRARTEVGAFSVKAGLLADYSYFEIPGNFDDYLDVAADLLLTLQPSQRHRFSLGADYVYGHDPFGSIRTENTAAASAELDEWQKSEAAVTYRIGAKNALLNSTIKAGVEDKRYETNRAQTIFLDHQINAIDYELAVNYSPKTSLVLDLGYRDIDFDLDPLGSQPRDSQQLTTRVGIRWEATAKTSGELKLGSRRREFRQSQQPDDEAFSWLLSIDWAPVSQSKISFSTGQRSTESYRGDTRFIDGGYASLAFSQVLSQRLSGKFELTYSEDDFVGTTAREDNVFAAAVSAGYRLSRHANLFAAVTHAIRDSNEQGRDFEATAARVGLRFSR